MQSGGEKVLPLNQYSFLLFLFNSFSFFLYFLLSLFLFPVDFFERPVAKIEPKSSDASVIWVRAAKEKRSAIFKETKKVIMIEIKSIVFSGHWIASKRKTTKSFIRKKNLTIWQCDCKLNVVSLLLTYFLLRYFWNGSSFLLIATLLLPRLCEGKKSLKSLNEKKKISSRIG